MSTFATGTFLLAILLLLAAGCSSARAPERGAPPPLPSERDPHSFARPDEIVVRHVDLDLAVDFSARRLTGKAALEIENLAGASTLHLDTRDLAIERVTADSGEEPLRFSLGEPVAHLGRALAIEVGPKTRRVTVHYSTSPAAAALQWLEPAQTAGKRHPFLYTQSQAILARTWIPCQDTPGVRTTYRARVKVPAGLMAVMSARNVQRRSPSGVYEFDMPQAVPSYLFALAAGDLEFRPLGPRSGVYAEPGVVEKAANEFADTESMIAAAEKLYGPYRWERYDLLVLPPSFPFGGMENPRVTFATPTILAGDRSLVALVAHELAHSWSGNLVTNATWNDFWLNEGFTVYFEHRIMEEVYGRDYSEMLAMLGEGELRKFLGEIGAGHRDSHLLLDLAGRDPDDGMTDVAYQKGYLFLRHVEETAGRKRFDAFLRDYFDRFAFRSMSTAGFVAHLRERLVKGDAALEEALEIDAWVYGPGLPASTPKPQSAAMARVEEEVGRWAAGAAPRELETAGWSSHQWVHFLRHLPAGLPPQRMAELDAAFRFSGSGNSEILCDWLLHVVANRYEPAYPALERFLTGIGRRKFLKPLYTKLAETPEGLERARRIYAIARPGYHSVSTGTIDEILKWPGQG